MAYTTINKPSATAFNTKLYSGNSSTQSITGVGFQPDFTWIKDRNDTGHHQLLDAVRGATKYLSSNDNGVEATSSDGLTAFDSDGFSLGNNTNYNNSSRIYASWNWKAGGGQGSSNTDGSINTTYTSVNTTAGFSISKYSGNTTAGATIGHGLGAVPKMILIKNLTSSENWVVYHSSLGATKFLSLNRSDAVSTSSGVFNNTEPTSSLISLGDFGSVNESPEIYVAYAFTEKQGYSKFGKLISNGSDDGTFTYTGFAPKWVMVKPNVTDGWSHWYIFDTTRDTNLNDKPLYANLSTQEAYYGGSPATNYAQIDMLSNGFKIRRGSGWGGGGNGTELIYIAFGQSLVGTNNVPCTAR